jgi:hypothetical protein
MDDTTQNPTHPEGDTGGGRSDRGPATHVPGEQQPGGAVPPYEGRKTQAEPDQEGGTYRDGARVGGATGPVEDDDFKADSPSDTPGGRSASPADEQPAAEMPGGRDPETGDDRTSHIAGVPKGEDGGG